MRMYRKFCVATYISFKLRAVWRPKLSQITHLEMVSEGVPYDQNQLAAKLNTANQWAMVQAWCILYNTHTIDEEQGKIPSRSKTCAKLNGGGSRTVKNSLSWPPAISHWSYTQPNAWRPSWQTYSSLSSLGAWILMYSSGRKLAVLSNLAPVMFTQRVSAYCPDKDTAFLSSRMILFCTVCSTHILQNQWCSTTRISSDPRGKDGQFPFVIWRRAARAG